MNVTISIDDLTTLFFDGVYDCDGTAGVSVEEIKKKFMSMAIGAFAENVYNDYWNEDFVGVAKDAITSIVNEDKDVIIDSVVKLVAEQVMRKKTIRSIMPKKSEINESNKELDKYIDSRIEKFVCGKAWEKMLSGGNL